MSLLDGFKQIFSDKAPIVRKTVQEQSARLMLALDSQLETQIFAEAEDRIKAAKRAQNAYSYSKTLKEVAGDSTPTVTISNQIVNDWSQVAPISKMVGLLRQQGYNVISESPLVVQL